RAASLRAMGDRLSRARLEARHFGDDLQSRDGEVEARLGRPRPAAVAARVSRTALAISEPACVRLAHPDRQGEVARGTDAARPPGKGFWSRPLHPARAMGHGDRAGW